MSFLFSCASENTDINQDFEKKFGKEVDKIKSQRQPDRNSNKEIMFSSPPTKEEVAIAANGDSNYYPYFDTEKFGESAPKNYLPNGEFYEASRINNPSNSLSSNIFEVTYETTPHPPFQKVGKEFDWINIPDSDIYGVSTNMAEKSYMVAGVDAVNKSINFIKSQRSDDDLSDSDILIKEKKALKRQKRIASLSDDDFTIKETKVEDNIEKNDKKSSTTKTKKILTRKRAIAKNLSKKSSKISVKKTKKSPQAIIKKSLTNSANYNSTKPQNTNLNTTKNQIISNPATILPTITAPVISTTDLSGK